MHAPPTLCRLAPARTQFPSTRNALSLFPSQTLSWHQDYPLDAQNEEIEEWFGTSLARLYEAD